jgi:hypothetical protein
VPDGGTVIWRAAGRVAIAGAVLLVAVSLGALLAGDNSRVVGLDEVGVRPELSDSGTAAPSPSPSATPTGGTKGCDPRDDPRLRRANVEVATAVRYVVGVAPPGATVPPSPRPQPFAVAYPAVLSGAPPAAARRISADLRRRTIAAISHAVQSPPKDTSAPPSAPPQPTLDSARDRLLGVRIDTLVPGERHLGSLAVTYDLTTGASVALQDLFPAGPDCQRPLCRAIGARLVETLGREQLHDPEDADAAVAGQQPVCPYLDRASTGGGFDRAFLVQPDGLALLFGACEIVACAGGPTVVTVPFGMI